MGSMKITPDLLKKAGVGSLAETFAPFLASACERYGITSTNQVSAFLANAVHESANFTCLTESLYYRDPKRLMQVFPTRITSLDQANKLVRNPRGVALAVYSNRLGNGPESTEDGWKYIGRGLFQLSGLTNYLLAEKDNGRPYTKQPNLVALPEDACLTAAWFWSVNHCGALADRWDMSGLTRVINGQRMLGLNERVALATEFRNLA